MLSHMILRRTCLTCSVCCMRQMRHLSSFSPSTSRGRIATRHPSHCCRSKRTSHTAAPKLEKNLEEVVKVEEAEEEEERRRWRSGGGGGGGEAEERARKRDVWRSGASEAKEQAG